LVLSERRRLQQISIDAGAVLQAPALSSKCGSHLVENQWRRLTRDLLFVELIYMYLYYEFCTCTYYDLVLEVLLIVLRHSVAGLHARVCG